MAWQHGMAKRFSPSETLHEMHAALVSDDGIAIFGHRGRSERIVFGYKSGDSEINFLASRFSSDGVLTDTWTVGLATIRRDLETLHGASVANNNLAKVVRDIEDALLTDPAWPSNFGRPDLHARRVLFQDSLP